MSLSQTTLWSLQSPDGTNWTARVSTSGVVTWISGGPVVTATPPVFQGVPDSTVWTPSISNLGIVSTTSGTVGGSDVQAALVDASGQTWLFVVDAGGVVSLIQFFPNTGRMVNDVIGEQVGGYCAIAGLDAEEWPWSDWDVFINGTICTQVLFGQISGDATLGQRSTLRLTLRGTPQDQLVSAEIGQRVDLVWRDALQLSGIIEDRRLYTDTDYGGSLQLLELECAGWERIAERRIINKTYTNQNTNAIFGDLLTTYLAPDGLTAGVIDDGVTVTLVKADYIRLHDVLRDLAEASGGVYTVNPFKQVEFRKVSTLPGRVVMENAIAVGSIESAVGREDYRNVQIVKATGNAGNVQYSTRENAAEIAARQAIEGGSGRYEDYLEVSHPTSDDTAELQRYGISVGVLNLRTYGAHSRRFTADTLTPGFRLGEIIQVDLPAHGLAGAWQVAKISWRTYQHLLRVTIEAVQTSALQRAYQAWLRIVQAGKANIQVPAILTTFTDTITTLGTSTWTVPPGVTLVEITIYGASGGGGGGAYTADDETIITDPPSVGASGGAGGPGAKAVTIIDVTPGDVLTVVVGARGTGGAGQSTTITTAEYAVIFNPATGSNGGTGLVSYVQHLGVVVCQANGGGGGTGGRTHEVYAGFGATNGSTGTAGNGIGDGVTVGGGMRGNPGGGPGITGSNGTNAQIEIRY